MANYMLTGIDDNQWRRFKAQCTLQGISIRKALLNFIDSTDESLKAQLNFLHAKTLANDKSKQMKDKEDKP